MLIALESFSLCRFQHLQTYLGGTSIGLGLIAPSVNMTQKYFHNALKLIQKVTLIFPKQWQRTDVSSNKFNWERIHQGSKSIRRTFFVRLKNKINKQRLLYFWNCIQIFFFLFNSKFWLWIHCKNNCHYCREQTSAILWTKDPQSLLRQLLFVPKWTHVSRWLTTSSRYITNLFLKAYIFNYLCLGNTSFSVDRLLAQWRSKFGENSHSKLIILLDVPDGSQWLTAVYNTKTQKVALQTVKYTESSGEMGHFFSLYFTTKWIQFNKNNIFEYKQVTSTLTDRGITCFYSLSLPWRKNQLISCTDDEFKIQVSRMTCVPCFDLLAVSIACGEFMVKLLTLDKIIKNCRRVRMKWFSPKVFSIAQGIKLFKS